MAFNLKKVLKALLLSSSQPLAIKDVQAAFTRFHDLASSLPLEETAEESAAAPEAAGAPGAAIEAAAPAEVPAELAEVFIEAPSDPELYATCRR